MTPPQAAPFELRLRSVQWPITVVLASLDAVKTIRPGKNLINMLGVVGPVGGDMQGPAGGEPIGNEFEEARRDDAALMVPFLRPRVREVEIEPRQGAGRDLVAEYFDGVVMDDSQVADVCFLGLQHAMSDTRFVDLDAQEVPIRMRHGLFDEGLPITEADLQDEWRRPPEQALDIERLGLVVDTQRRPERVESALL